MTDFIEAYYHDTRHIADEGFDRERAVRKAFSLLLPVMMESELTDRQSVCLKYKYLHHKSQQEIATLLHLSQPTVSRHISTAKDIVNHRLKYCYAAVSAALDEYDRL